MPLPVWKHTSWYLPSWYLPRRHHYECMSACMQPCTLSTAHTCGGQTADLGRGMRDARERSSVSLLGRKALAGDDAEAAAASAAAAGDAANRILEVALTLYDAGPAGPC